MDVMKMEFANAKKMLKAQIVITAWMVSMAFQIANLVSVMKKGQMDQIAMKMENVLAKKMSVETNVMNAKMATPTSPLVINVTLTTTATQIANLALVVIKEVKASLVIKKLDNVNVKKISRVKIVILAKMVSLVFHFAKVNYRNIKSINFQSPIFPECGCSCRGSMDEGKTCSPQGKCTCKPGYTGDKCDKCTEGFYLEGEGLMEKCTECACHPDGTDGKQSCNAEGQCTCTGVVIGKKCDQCKPGFYDFPDCKDCECDKDGSVNSVCNDQGICACKEGIEGDRCSRCKPGFSGFPNCFPETGTS